MRVERDPSCCRDLNWRLTLPDALPLELAVERLQRHGWRDVSTVTFVRVLEAASGHQLVIVPRTRRVQLRLDYLVPHQERPTIAAELGDQVEACLGD